LLHKHNHLQHCSIVRTEQSTWNILRFTSPKHRKFWKENLPRLKYWNPAVPMVVNRTHNNAGPARLTVYMRDGSGEPVDVNNFPTTSWSNPVSKAPAPAKGEKAVVINMKNRHSSQILSEFLQTTGAVQVKPTPQEEQEQDEIRELLRKAAADSARTAAENAIKRREKAMLAKARDEAAAIKAAS